MRALLDSSTKRRLEILEQLNQSADWISSNELANTNKASLRTINSDVQYLKEKWFPHLIIETSKKNGVRLSTPPSSHASLYYNSVIANSEAFQLLEKIFFEPEKNIEDWEEEMFISESSLYRIANQLGESLTHYDLKLQKRPCHITDYNETYVRYFHASYFQEVYGMHEWPFSLDRHDTVILAQELLDALDFRINEVIIMHATYLLAVSFERMGQGFFTSIEHVERITTAQRDLFYLHEEGINDLIRVLDLELSDKVLNDLINSVYFIKSLVIDKVDNQKIKDRIALFLHEIQTALDLDIDENSRRKINNVMVLTYLQHLEYPFTDYILFNRYEFNATAIRNSFPTFTQVVEKGLEDMEREMNFPWFSEFRNNVIYWLTVKWQKLPSILENKKEKARLLILSNLGVDHAELLAELITKNFGGKVDISIYQNSIIFLEDDHLIALDDYDFFVTTFLRDSIPSDKIIVVDAIPSDQDWGKIRRAINQVNKIVPALASYLQKH